MRKRKERCSQTSVSANGRLSNLNSVFVNRGCVLWAGFPELYGSFPVLDV